MVEFRAIQNTYNDIPYGKKFQDLVYTRQEYIGIAVIQFLDRIDGFYNIGQGIIKADKSSLQYNKVASELYSLIKDLVLIIMIHFLVVYHKSFWLPNFKWLK